MRLTLEEIAGAVKGIVVGDGKQIVTNISTDTRTIKEGSLFVALRGESFDAHSFVKNAFEDGAVCAMVEQKTEGCHILVEDTKRALGDLARYYMESLDIPVVAVTGSTGKTTTKDIIASVLSQKYNVLKTEGNFNNDIGVPLTIFRLEKEHQVAVIEMGMNHFNEISYLSSIARPDVAVITNVGVSHIENLGSRQGILKAKCEIFEHMKSDGVKILNGDDDMLSTVKEADICWYGGSRDNQVYGYNIQPMGLEGIKAVIGCSKGEIEVTVPVPGNHMVSNAMAATAVGMALGLGLEEIKAGIEAFKPTKMRMDIIKTDKYSIINDVYNANPVSTKAGIDVLCGVKGKTACILGDMLELGSFSADLHRQVGEYAKEKGIDLIVCIGRESKYMYEGALGGKQVYYFEDKQEFIQTYSEILKDNMTILVKASRGMHFEKIVEAISK